MENSIFFIFTDPASANDKMDVADVGKGSRNSY